VYYIIPVTFFSLSSKYNTLSFNKYYSFIIIFILQSGRPIQRHSWAFTSCPYKDALNDYFGNGSHLPVRVVDISIAVSKKHTCAYLILIFLGV
jgi:hypothetical protein